MKRLILLSAVIVLVVASMCGCFYGRAAYRRYKEARGLQQARRFLTARDLADESVSLRQVLQLNPKNIEACLMIADLAELSHSPTAIDWRGRVAELAPSVSNRLKLGEAVAHFERAAGLEPRNELHQLNLAVLHLQSTNAATVAAARSALDQLTDNPKLAPLALRWLVAESLRQKDLTAAERLSSRLLADPRAQFDDFLLRLSVLQRSTKLTENANDSDAPSLGGATNLTSITSVPAVVPAATRAFTECLCRLQARATTNAIEFYAMCEWMGGHGLAEDALNWFAALDSKTRNSQLARLALANLYLAKKDWAALEFCLDQQKWADLEFLRWALLARAAWGQSHVVVGEACWRNGVRAAGERIGSLTLLLSLAEEWGRDPEELLRQIGRSFPGEQWALRELERRYMAAGNTRGLNLVYSSLAESKSGSHDATDRNNFATTSLLLKTGLQQAYEAACNLYHQNPADVIIASTYAYSMHLQDRTQEGLAVFERFEPQALETPSIALYYGVLLAAAGEKERAAHYLARAQGAALLPEEKAILQTANGQIRNLTGL